MIKFFPSDIVKHNTSGVLYHIKGVQTSNKYSLVYICQREDGKEFQFPVDYGDEILIKIGKIKNEKEK